MINIYDIAHGWAMLQIGYCSFEVSYLSYLKNEIDDLLNFDILNDEYECHKIILEGEGDGDLSLVAYLTFGEVDKDADDDDLKYGHILNIVWQRIYSDMDDSVTIMKFPYKKFKEEWKTLTEEIKEDYIRNFVCPQDEEEYEEALADY